ncbi:glycoside hydrolase family 19 protein [Algoriphagus namhaensis]
MPISLAPESPDGSLGGGTPDGSNENCEEVDANILGVTVYECFEEEEEEKILNQIENPCDVSEDELKEIFPNGDNGALSVLKDLLKQYGEKFNLIDKNVISQFLAQAGHETGGFNSNSFSENLNYTTAERLIEVWPSRFSLTDSNKANSNYYLRNSEKLTNLVYGGWMGNGPESSGDGYKYRGRGAFHLTGKANYKDLNNYYSDSLGDDFDFLLTPDLVATNLEAAYISSMWFFKTRFIDRLSQSQLDDVERVTRKINGGVNGLVERQDYFERALEIIEC